ncbi:hypothetical protein DIPPA_33378 [Diplonema papillatum]|nr:hypothetical protein DIPPA_33378 [Diplonema papillatum]
MMKNEDSNVLAVLVSLHDSSCVFDREVRVPAGASADDFRRAVEEAFDQRVQLSFSRRRRVRPLIPPELLQNLHEIRTAVTGAVQREKRQGTTQVPLNADSWAAFSTLPSHKLRCNAWTVYQGQYLSNQYIGSAGSQPKQTVYQQLDAECEKYPKSKRLGILKGRVAALQNQMEHDALPKRQRGRLLKLYQTVSEEEREATTNRLWRNAQLRNAKHLEEEKELNGHLVRSLDRRTRRVPERSQRDEDVIAQLFEAPLRARAENLEEKEARLAATLPKVKTALLPLADISESVSRLYAAADDNRRKIEESRIRVYGKDLVEKKLTKQELQDRIDQLYTKAVDKKAENLLKLSTEYTSPRARMMKVNPKKMQDTVERLAQPKQR